MPDSVLYQCDAGVVILTLNEPETRNAISARMVDEIVDHAHRINEDLSIRCVIVTGSGKGFCSGGNVKEMKKRGVERDRTPAETRRDYESGIQRIPLAMYNLEVPTIAAVNGAATGAGCDLSLMCDIRIAARSAKFAENFLRVGLIPGDGGAWFLPRAVGTSKAYEMAFTADFIDAQEAARIGLVSKLVDDDALMDEALAMARRIASHPTHSLRLTKRLFRDSQQMTLPVALDFAASAQALVQSTHDQHEAVLAFTEKRPPRFEHR